MTYIDSIIAIIATTVITSLAELFSERLIKLFTKYIPKNKRVALLASLMIKYIFFALLMVFLVLKMDFDKIFVVSISLLVLICSFFIAKDALFYTIRSFTFKLEKQNTQSKMIEYIDALGKCDSKNREKQDEYKKKIRELTEEKDS